MSRDRKDQRRTLPAVGGALSKQRLRLWLRILKVSRLVTARLRDRLRDEHGSTLPRFDVMAALYREERGLRMSDLSGVLKVSNGNVTGIVDRLSAEGRIVRLPVEDDRRATLARLTRKGREDFERLAALHEAWVDELLADLDAEEAEVLIGLLGRLASRLEAREQTP
jgi:DNA-binding MarR family transcriptional regulator